MSSALQAAPVESPKNVYILITQCLQNGFFLADENRLCLPKDIVLRMLIGDQPYWQTEGLPDAENRRKISQHLLEKGPLYQFFEAVTAPSKRKEPLHIVHIRDWHAPSPHYEEERKLYGPHCEADTWEAEYIDGFERFLTPWKRPTIRRILRTGRRSPWRLARRIRDRRQHPVPASTADSYLGAARQLDGLCCNRHEFEFRPAADGNLRFYDVRSDSVFDFKKPASDELDAHVNNLRRVINGDHPEAAEAQAPGTQSHLQLVLDHIIKPEIPAKDRNIYVVVIGVYTDIKIKTLLMGLRVRYEIDGLFVSDVLTDAPTLERHLQALDFIAKVLNVEVLNSLNEVAGRLNPGTTHIVPRDLTRTTIRFREYANHFADRQYILAYQDNRLREYLDLTSRRSIEIYNRINSASTYLMYIGYLFLAMTVLAGILKIAGYPGISNEVILVTGGLSFAQLLTSFYALPIAQLRNNLNSLVRLRNYLETYSNITALLRHHLTLAERLKPNTAQPGFDAIANRELELLEKQIKIIYDAAERMRSTFVDLAPGVSEIMRGAGADSGTGSNPTQSP